MEPEKLVTYMAACDRGRDNLIARNTETLAHRAVSMVGGGAAGCVQNRPLTQGEGRFRPAPRAVSRSLREAVAEAVAAFPRNRATGSSTSPITCVT